MTNTIEDRNEWMVNFIADYYLSKREPQLLYRGELCYDHDLPDVAESMRIQDIISHSFNLRSVMGNRVTFVLECRDLTLCDGTSFTTRQYVMSGTMKWMVDHSAKDQPMFSTLERAFGSEHLETLTPDDIDRFIKGKSATEGEFLFAVEEIDNGDEK